MRSDSADPRPSQAPERRKRAPYPCRSRSSKASRTLNRGRRGSYEHRGQAFARPHPRCPHLSHGRQSSEARSGAEPRHWYGSRLRDGTGTLPPAQSCELGVLMRAEPTAQQNLDGCVTDAHSRHRSRGDARMCTQISGRHRLVLERRRAEPGPVPRDAGPGTPAGSRAQLTRRPRNQALCAPGTLN